MWDQIRGGVLVLLGLAAGFALGFVVWGREGLGLRFSREYEDGERVRVVRVIDGDTIVLADGMHVRYRGCDTPEVYHFIRDPQPFAEEASARNRELVEGAWVALRLPPEDGPALDAHGRLLAEVRLWPAADASDPTVGEIIVSEGLARAKTYAMKGIAADRLRRAEAEARTAARGIWGKPKAPAGGFVASRRAKFVHRRDCIYAKRIAPSNFMRFNALDAALATGRAKCPTCLRDESSASTARERSTE